MNVKALAKFGELHAPAISAQLKDVESQFGRKLPKSYCDLMMLTDGFSLGNGLFIYSSDEVVERNMTFGVQSQLINYFAIGDNSGGRIILMPFDGENVYLSDIGFMHQLNLQIIAKSLNDWVQLNCDLGI